MYNVPGRLSKNDKTDKCHSALGLFLVYNEPELENYLEYIVYSIHSYKYTTCLPHQFFLYTCTHIVAQSVDYIGQHGQCALSSTILLLLRVLWCTPVRCG
jgi:hypothetical protein